MINRRSILKPHYQLLGMLIERQELRRALQGNHQSHYPILAQTVDDLITHLKALDREIYEQYHRALAMFDGWGRTASDLQAFIGYDLNDDLHAALQID